jgi:beta-lactam-binding protein with PASTA domain
MAEPPRVPPDPDDETVIVPPEDETVVADDWGPETEVFVEEEETGPPPPRRPVIWPWLLALLVFVLGGLGAYFLLARDDDEAQAPTTSSTVATTTRQVTVPDVVGTTSSEATATLRDEGLKANLVSVPSDRAPGTVIAQSPSPGDEVAEGSSVRLNVAETAKPAPTTTEAETTAPTTTAPTTTAAPEPKPATVPDVVGQKLADAARTFNEEGLKVAVVYVPSNEPAGSVVAQARPPGAQLQAGDTVQLNVSTGAEPAPDVQVPDVTGEKQNGGREQLKSAGFEVLTLQEQTTDSSRVGSVLSQTPSGGANIPRGSLVIAYVGA